jgi:hypothetical protein
VRGTHHAVPAQIGVSVAAVAAGVALGEHFRCDVLHERLVWGVHLTSTQMRSMLLNLYCFAQMFLLLTGVTLMIRSLMRSTFTV